MATTARKDLTHLCRALKTPSLLASIDRLSKRAREDSWSHEEFLAACLERELSARQTHGGDNHIKGGLIRLSIPAAQTRRRTIRAASSRLSRRGVAAPRGCGPGAGAPRGAPRRRHRLRGRCGRLWQTPALNRRQGSSAHAACHDGVLRGDHPGNRGRFEGSSKMERQTSGK